MLAVFVCAVALILISAVMTKTCGFGAKAGGALDYGTNWRSIGAGFLRVSFSFSAGILVYWIWLFRRPQWSIPPAFLLVAFAIILASAPVVEARIAFDLIAIIVVFPLLVLLGAVSAPSRTGSPIYSWLGATSYAVFVLHFPLYKLSLFAREYTHASPSWIYGAGYLILLYTTATVLDLYVDGRVRGMLKNRFFAKTTKNIGGQHHARA